MILAVTAVVVADESVVASTATDSEDVLMAVVAWLRVCIALVVLAAPVVLADEALAVAVERAVPLVLRAVSTEVIALVTSPSDVTLAVCALLASDMLVLAVDAVLVSAALLLVVAETSIATDDVID